MKKRWLVVNSLIVFACLLAIWSRVVAFAHLPVYILPGPRAVAEALLGRYPSLLSSLWITAEEAACGLAASIFVGVAIAMIFAQLRWLRQLVFPYTILLQTVPIVAIAPLIINWVGAGIFAVTIVTFIICLAPIIANTTQGGLISVDENLIHLFLMYKATPAQILFKAATCRTRCPSLYGHSHLGGHQRHWRSDGGAVCGIDARGRGRTWLCDYLCE